VAHRWGLVRRRVVVRLPGGSVEVELGDEATLVGPATYVASVEVAPLAERSSTVLSSTGVAK
jgi:diaminopimelate epimerase